MILSQGTYFGSKKTDRELERCSLNVSSYLPNESIPLHYHELPYASIAMSGAYLESRNTQSKDLHVDSRKILFRPHGYEHANKFGKTHGVCFNLEFKKVDCSIQNECATLIENLHVLECTVEFTKVINGFLQNYEDDELQCLVDECLMSISNKEVTTKRSDVIKKSFDYILANYQNSISLSDIAFALNVHPAYLARTFKSKLNITVGEFIRGTRIAQSFMELCAESQPLTSLAYNTGFYDQSHFIKCFKSAYGISPLAHKKSIG
jgi:AraC family transcriptional regulator